MTFPIAERPMRRHVVRTTLAAALLLLGLLLATLARVAPIPVSGPAV